MRTRNMPAIALGLVVAFGLAPRTEAAPWAVQATCPEGSGWAKIEDLDGYTYTYTPPAGHVVTSNCYKHSTYVHYGSGPTVTADWHALTRFPWFRRYELSHASFLIEPIFTVTPTFTATVTIEPTEVPSDTPTDTPTDTSVPTDAPTPTGTPTDTATATPVDTEEPMPTPTATLVEKCQSVEAGRWFYLTGPGGQIRRLASFQINPNNGRWAIPNVAAQQACLGFVAVNAQAGEIIYRNCDGTYSTYCYKCVGGGPAGVYGNDE